MVPMQSGYPSSPSLAIACAAGGFKGVFVHGVLSAFEAAGLRADAYAASSASVASAGFAAIGSANEVGVEIPTSCEQGVCGTCLTRVIEGVPDHRDLYLTPEEQAANDQFTPCCSRAKSARLVLDL